MSCGHMWAWMFSHGWIWECQKKKNNKKIDAILWPLQELKRFPTLQSDIAAAANEALERFRDESRRTVQRLVDMESSYLTVEFFRKLHLEPEKNTNTNPNQPGPNADRYNDNHFRRIGMEFSNCFPLHSFFFFY